MVRDWDGSSSSGSPRTATWRLSESPKLKPVPPRRRSLAERSLRGMLQLFVMVNSLEQRWVSEERRGLR